MGSVRDLPGVRPGARAFLFYGADDDGISTRIEDFGDDWLGIAAPSRNELETPLSNGDPLEVEVPQPGGSLYLIGRLTEQRTERVPLLIVRIEEVGADPEVSHTREARQHFRQSLWLPVRQMAFRREPNAPWEEAGGILRNIGAGGASIIADTSMPYGARVYIACPVPLDPSGITIYGTVVGRREGGSPRRPRCIVNIRFDTFDRKDRSWLAHQLHRYQWYVRTRRR